MQTAIGWFDLQLTWLYWPPETFVRGKSWWYTLIKLMAKGKICKEGKETRDDHFNLKYTSTELLSFAYLSVIEKINFEK